MQFKISHCFYLIWTHLVGNTKWFAVGAAFAELESTWKRLCCEPRLAVTSASLGTLWWAPQCEVTQAATCANLWSLS